jgi:hypothetical protein
MDSRSALLYNPPHAPPRASPDPHAHRRPLQRARLRVQPLARHLPRPHLHHAGQGGHPDRPRLQRQPDGPGLLRLRPRLPPLRGPRRVDGRPLGLALRADPHRPVLVALHRPDRQRRPLRLRQRILPGPGHLRRPARAGQPHRHAPGALPVRSRRGGRLPQPDARHARLVPLPRARLLPGRDLDVGPAGRRVRPFRAGPAVGPARLAAGLLGPGRRRRRLGGPVLPLVPRPPRAAPLLQPRRARADPRRAGNRGSRIEDRGSKRKRRDHSSILYPLSSILDPRRRRTPGPAWAPWRGA